jgi:hypothetical protein
MARTTPAQKPRGWANITFIKTSRFGTGFLLCSKLTLDPAASRRKAAWMAYLGLFRLRRAAAVALLTHSFQVFISIRPAAPGSAAEREYQESAKRTRRNDHLYTPPLRENALTCPEHPEETALAPQTPARSRQSATPCPCNRFAASAIGLAGIHPPALMDQALCDYA